MRRTLVDVLDLEEVRTDVFRAAVREGAKGRLFGGQVAAQALVAAERTVGDERLVHSLHAYFLRPGNASMPVDFEVERERDGRSFTTRHVLGRQRDEVIFSLTASFQVDEVGMSHQELVLDVPPPSECKELDEWFSDDDMESFGDWVSDYRESSPLEMRFWEPPPPIATNNGPRPPRHGVWMRLREKLPDDRMMHVCSLAYASDLFLMGTAMRPHGVAILARQIVGASLDHAMWFHEDFRADEWFYYDLESPWAGHSRGLNVGRFFTESGVHFASAVQEGMMRIRRDITGIKSDA